MPFGGVNVMNHFNDPFKLARQEIGISRHVPITHFNSATVIESCTGAMFSVIKLRGVPFDTESRAVVNEHQRIWHRAILSLNENFCLLGTIHRRKEQLSLSQNFSNAFSQEIDDAYMKQFRNTSMYVNDIYLAVIYKGITTGGIKRFANFLHKNSRFIIKNSRENLRQFHMRALDKAVLQVMASLSDFGPVLLGSRDDLFGASEVLAYLSIFVNGGEAMRLPSQTISYPNGNLAHLLTTKRILFGEGIQFQGASKHDSQLAVILTIKRYATSSSSLMLDPLLQLPCEYISSHSFAIESKSKADQFMSRHANKFKNAKDPAISQIEEVTEARDQLACDKIMMGYHHNTVMLLGTSLHELEEQVSQAVKHYANAGLVAVRELIGQEPAFWSQIPTNLKYIARASLISSRNFTDFFPLHNYQCGFKDQNYLGGAVTLVETPAKTPLWLNLHARGPKDNPSAGHTTLIGGNGSGKTVMMCFLDAQLNRYGGNSIFFDRNRGAEIYIRASRGYYTVLSPAHKLDVHFNPLQLNDTPLNRKFCKAWLQQLLYQELDTALDENDLLSLEQCIEYAFEELAPEYRNLSNATKILPIHFKHWPRLMRWLRADSNHPEGEYAYLFDNDEDRLTMQTKMGFDLTYFLDNEPAYVLTPVLMYLFHRLELMLTKSGQLLSVFLDEAWQYLDNPYWQDKLKKWLPTLRKLNCHIIFATQSPKSVVDSAISHTILDNCATNIYFPNPQAKAIHYIEGFNLTQAEYNCIRDNEPQSRLFLYKQGHVSALAKLNLSHLRALLRVMSGTQASVQALERIRRAVGDDPNDWLPIFINKECDK